MRRTNIQIECVVGNRKLGGWVILRSPFLLKTRTLSHSSELTCLSLTHQASPHLSISKWWIPECPPGDHSHFRRANIFVPFRPHRGGGVALRGITFRVERRRIFSLGSDAFRESRAENAQPTRRDPWYLANGVTFDYVKPVSVSSPSNNEGAGRFGRLDSSVFLDPCLRYTFAVAALAAAERRMA